MVVDLLFRIQRRRQGDALPRPAPPFAQARRHPPRGDSQFPERTDEGALGSATDTRDRGERRPHPPRAHAITPEIKLMT